MSQLLALADLAEEQWGQFTAAQATEIGVPRQTLTRLAKQGSLEHMAHGVYRMTGAPTTTHDRLRAAWLATEPDKKAATRLRETQPIVVSHRSAAVLRDLGDLDADRFEFSTPIRKQSRRDDVQFYKKTLDNDQWDIVEGLPVTTGERTITDLAAARIDGGHLAGVVRDALTRDLVRVPDLTIALRPYAHLYGAQLGGGDALLRNLLGQSGISENLRQLSRLVETSSTPDLLAKINQPTAISVANINAIVNSPALDIAKLSPAVLRTPAVLSALAAATKAIELAAKAQANGSAGAEGDAADPETTDT